jgi:hypothetical protein
MQTRDDSLRRYLLGSVTDDERDAVERQLLSDDDIAARLTALDDELMLAAARRRLTPADQRAFEAAVQSSPARLRRFAETRALTESIAELAGHEDVLAAIPRANSRTPSRLAFAFAAVVVVIVVWQLLRTTDDAPAEPERASAPAAIPEGRRSPAVVATLTLSPRIDRTTTPGKVEPQNQLSLSDATTSVRLLANATVKTDGFERARAEVVPQGGSKVPIAETPVVRLGPQSVNVEWTFASAQIGAGAHRLVVVGETPGGGAEVLFEWFFTVVRVPAAETAGTPVR